MFNGISVTVKFPWYCRLATVPAAQVGFPPPEGVILWKPWLQEHFRSSGDSFTATFLQVVPFTHSLSVSFLVHASPSCMPEKKKMLV